MKTKIGIFLLISLVLIAAACTAPAASPTNPASPTSAPALPTETPPPAATDTPLPTDLPAPSPTESQATTAPTEPAAEPSPTEAAPTPVQNPLARLAPGQPVVLSFIHMLDENAGWAIGGNGENGDHVLFSADGGQTWRDVTPPEPAPEGDEPKKAAVGFFLDQDHAWVTYAYVDRYAAPQGPVVWHTADGGQSWRAGQPLEADSFFLPWILAQPLVFSDIENGWLMENLHDAGMGHNYVAVYRTREGGAAWERIVDPMGSGALQSAGKTAMVFADSQTGLVTYDQGAYVSVYVDWTFDGGLTWEQQFLPSPESDPDLFENAFCTASSPTFFSPDSLALAVDCKVFNADGSSTSSNFVYTTPDAGKTWTSNPFPGGNLEFTTPDLAWALGREIQRSLDGGQTWALVKNVNWDGQFSFVSETAGWAVARADGEIAFVQTTDGGITWNLLEPQIVP